MASPVDAGRATTAITSTVGDGTDAINLPSGIQSGDLLFVAVDFGNVNPAAFTVTGFSVLTTASGIGSSSQNDGGLAWKAATGSEGSTVTFTNGGISGQKTAAVAWRITGADTGTTPVLSTLAQSSGTDTSPDPASLSPAGGSKDYLWLWVGMADNQATMPPSGNPTNYSNPVGIQSGGSGSAASKMVCFGASRQNTTATEDPPVWTLSTASRWGAWTVAIYPAPSAPPVVLLPGSPLNALSWLGS